MGSVSTLTLTSWGRTAPHTAQVCTHAQATRSPHISHLILVTSYWSPHIIMLISMDPSLTVSQTSSQHMCDPTVRLPGHLISITSYCTSYWSPHVGHLILVTSYSWIPRSRCCRSLSTYMLSRLSPDMMRMFREGRQRQVTGCTSY